jgi:ABC-type bacteriocin/lantibiotic exporter with double-glycine peptidase domain
MRVLFMTAPLERWVKVRKQTHRPLPHGKITFRDFCRFIFDSTPKARYAGYILSVFVVTALGLFMPVVYNVLFSTIVPSKNAVLLIPALVFLGGVSFSLILLTIVRDVFLSRSSIIVKKHIEAAFMNRLLQLPISFFKHYMDGELAERVSGSTYLCGIIHDMLIPNGIAALFSVIYILPMFYYASAIIVPVLICIGLMIVFSVFIVHTLATVVERRLEEKAALGGFIFELFTGIEKIKSSGTEQHAFGQWEKRYAPLARLSFHPPAIITCYRAVIVFIMTLGTVPVFLVAAQTHIAIADFISFISALGMLNGAFLAFSGNIEQYASIRPLMRSLSPLMREEHEVTTDKPAFSSFDGTIEIQNLSFSYEENTPPVFDNFSLNIKKGQYIALVGKTGCGKSTLFRLLLGFERPRSGEILYNGQNINTIDIRSLRRNIGVVLQTSILMQGTIFENIALNVPDITPEEAWKAVQIACIADEIRKMPMGMFTIVAEGGGGFSGGQRQRLLLARAIASHPSILLLDEATSALDNLTQKRVEDNLKKLSMTRIVIAHRLSTVCHCDRIFVLENGHVVEDGTYTNLLSKNGMFTNFVAHQNSQQ